MTSSSGWLKPNLITEPNTGPLYSTAILLSTSWTDMERAYSHSLIYRPPVVVNICSPMLWNCTHRGWCGYYEENLTNSGWFIVILSVILVNFFCQNFEWLTSSGLTTPSFSNETTSFVLFPRCSFSWVLSSVMTAQYWWDVQGSFLRLSSLLIRLIIYVMSLIVTILDVTH